MSMVSPEFQRGGRKGPLAGPTLFQRQRRGGHPEKGPGRGRTGVPEKAPLDPLMQYGGSLHVGGSRQPGGDQRLMGLRPAPGRLLRAAGGLLDGSHEAAQLL